MAPPRIFLYALSTCGWCKKTKALLKELGVEYELVDVDLLDPDARAQTREELGRHNPRRSFPTILVDGEVIVGFDEEKIREALGRG